ncbi:dihydrofolate reductase [Corallococcus exiguus]|uniref:dihydrofolate reductase n=1 Tax=Corallococcus TaxID=83461 RepID=UPI000EEA6789|nr:MULTISPECIES: dihydrofolate reductase [Corallococcus]NNC04135.1 dihydrofolate reductase [Corallococcus exiguus]NPC46714.1 dihydrofolate reductase [Corallococcus exiguus]RKH83224.1 dihydrofolate reductase [Corallococcus sp. AB032C]
MSPRISAIVAMAANRVIGQGNTLPWRLPLDLARFKRLTMGHTLVMGRKTYDSIGRPLPGRTTVVLTRQRDWAAPLGVHVAHTVDDALRQAGDSEVFIAGGADLYAQTQALWQRLYLTRIERDFPGDAFFPSVDLTGWRLVEEERHSEGDLPFGFFTYERQG